MSIVRTTLVCLLCLLGSSQQTRAVSLPIEDRAPRSCPKEAVVGSWLWSYVYGVPSGWDARQSSVGGEQDRALVLLDDLTSRDCSFRRPLFLPVSPGTPLPRDKGDYPVEGTDFQSGVAGMHSVFAITCRFVSCDPPNMPGSFVCQEADGHAARQRSRLFRPPRA
jgi:hypothetical protein